MHELGSHLVVNKRDWLKMRMNISGNYVLELVVNFVEHVMSLEIVALLYFKDNCE